MLNTNNKIDNANIYSMVNVGGANGHHPLWENTLSYLPLKSFHTIRVLNVFFRDNITQFGKTMMIEQLKKIESMDISDILAYAEHFNALEKEKRGKDAASDLIVPNCLNLKKVTVKIQILPLYRCACDFTKLIARISQLPQLKIFEFEGLTCGRSFYLLREEEIISLTTSKTLEQLSLKYQCFDTPKSQTPSSTVNSFMSNVHKMNNLKKFEVSNIGFHNPHMSYALLPPTFGIAEARQIMELKQLDTLNLHNWNYITDEAWEFLYKMPKIIHLSLPISNLFGEDTLDPLIKLTHLESLTLSSTPSDRGYQNIALCKNLKSLTLTRACLTESQAKILNDSLKELKSLHVSHSSYQIPKGSDKAASILTKNLNLSELSLVNFNLTDEFIQEMIENNPNLESLNLSHSLVTSIGLIKLAQLPLLRTLKINGIKILSKELVLLILLKKLQHLTISFNQLNVDLLKLDNSPKQTNFFDLLNNLKLLEIDINKLNKSESGFYNQEEKLLKLISLYPQVEIVFLNDEEGGAFTRIFREQRLGLQRWKIGPPSKYHTKYDSFPTSRGKTQEINISELNYFPNHIQEIIKGYIGVDAAKT